MNEEELLDHQIVEADQVLRIMEDRVNGWGSTFDALEKQRIASATRHQREHLNGLLLTKADALISEADSE